jgi:hypothetical protein
MAVTFEEWAAALGLDPPRPDLDSLNDHWPSGE